MNQKLIIGSWQGDGFVHVFNADGTATFDDSPLTYKISGNTLICTDNSGTMNIEFNFSNNNNTLTLITNIKGETKNVVLTRIMNNSD